MNCGWFANNCCRTNVQQHTLAPPCRHHPSPRLRFRSRFRSILMLLRGSFFRQFGTQFRYIPRQLRFPNKTVTLDQWSRSVLMSHASLQLKSLLPARRDLLCLLFNTHRVSTIPHLHHCGSGIRNRQPAAFCFIDWIEQNVACQSLPTFGFRTPSDSSSDFE